MLLMSFGELFPLVCFSLTSLSRTEHLFVFIMGLRLTVLIEGLVNYSTKCFIIFSRICSDFYDQLDYNQLYVS